MKLRRSEALEQTSATDRELRRLEEQGMVVPIRSWKSLWLVPYYDHTQLGIIRWLVSCQRTADSVKAREQRLLTAKSEAY